MGNENGERKNEDEKLLLVRWRAEGLTQRVASNDSESDGQSVHGWWSLELERMQRQRAGGRVLYRDRPAGATGCPWQTQIRGRGRNSPEAWWLLCHAASKDQSTDSEYVLATGYAVDIYKISARQQLSNTIRGC